MTYDMTVLEKGCENLGFLLMRNRRNSLFNSMSIL